MEKLNFNQNQFVHAGTIGKKVGQLKCESIRAPQRQRESILHIYLVLILYSEEDVRISTRAQKNKK